MKEKKTKNFTVRITPTMYGRIEKYANKMNVSKGQIIRDAINLYLLELC